MNIFSRGIWPGICSTQGSKWLSQQTLYLSDQQKSAPFHWPFVPLLSLSNIQLAGWVERWASVVPSLSVLVCLGRGGEWTLHIVLMDNMACFPLSDVDSSIFPKPLKIIGNCLVSVLTSLTAANLLTRLRILIAGPLMSEFLSVETTYMVSSTDLVLRDSVLLNCSGVHYECVTNRLTNSFAA